MSNLGLYQTMTTCAKKVGGPLQFLGVVAGGGYVIFRTFEASCKKIYKEYKKMNDKNLMDTYVVHTADSSTQGLKFDVGDRFNVLEIAQNAVLIEKIGDSNNPYFVSIDVLRSISNFKN